MLLNEATICFYVPQSLHYIMDFTWPYSRFEINLLAPLLMELVDFRVASQSEISLSKFIIFFLKCEQRIAQNITVCVSSSNVDYRQRNLFVSVWLCIT